MGSSSTGTCQVNYFHPESVDKALASQVSSTTAANLAQQLKALGHPVRVRILSLISTEELCVCDLSVALKLSVSTISHHLKELRNAGIVKFRTEGRMAFYSIEYSSLTHHCLSSMREMTQVEELVA